MEVIELFSKIYGEGRPLIILHGLFGMSDNWATHAKIFTQHGWQVHAVDQRNHGRSPHTIGHSYDEMSIDLEHYIKRHNLKNVVLLGHSMGGKTVMNFAVRLPGLIDAMIVVDIASKAYPVHHQEYINAMKSVDFDKDKSRKAIEAKLREQLDNPGIIQFFMKSLYWKSREELAWRFDLNTLEMNLDEIGVALDYGYYTGPSLFISGGKSGYILQEDHDSIYEHFPQADIITIPGAGHWVHAEAKDSFSAEVLGFLEAL